MRSILVISRKEEAFQAIRSCFSGEFEVNEAPELEAGLDMLRKRRHEFLFIDISVLRESAQGNGYKADLDPFWHLYPSLKIIVMSPREMIRDAVEVVKEGASHYLTYPLNPEEIKHAMDHIEESVRVRTELDYLRDQFWGVELLDIMETKNLQMRQVYDKVRLVAPTKSTVLLIGETGTGKGVLANLIHRHSNRRDAQFISVHCGAIPDTLIESELFGHEKGAFTGAFRKKLGKFEIAGGGTLFVDEVGTISPPAQIKLLQVLQDGTFQRLGGVETIKADVRVIAATNADLKEMIDEGRFRKDLYYRLNVFPVEIPPLKDRLEDIPHLVEVILKKLNRETPKEIYDVAPKVLEAFRNYSWPGNIRELENLMERAHILETSSVLTPENFPSELFEFNGPSVLAINASLTLAEARKRGIENIERSYLKDLLTRNRGKIRDSAMAAGITTRQLHKLMTRHGMHKEAFK
jgi:DNA-binding NtrC family response regulator